MKSLDVFTNLRNGSKILTHILVDEDQKNQFYYLVQPLPGFYMKTTVALTGLKALRCYLFLQKFHNKSSSYKSLKNLFSLKECTWLKKIETEFT